VPFGGAPSAIEAPGGEAASDVARPEPEALPVDIQHVFKRYRRYTHRDNNLKARALNWLRGHSDQYVEFEVLKDVSFTIPRGQMVAIVGRNGAGKTTLLRVLSRIVEPDAGTVRLNGRVSPLLELGAGFAGELTGRKNVYLYGALLGLSRREIRDRFDDIAEFSGIEDFLDSPVKHYSSGMLVRLAFAVAAQINPDVLLLDEVLAVGDAEFQTKCLKRITDFRDQGKTILLVTHAPQNVVDICDRSLLIDHGQLIEDGEPGAVLSAYKRLLA
jgi:lipopolysaccharide transport system ATP-binding protein